MDPGIYLSIAGVAFQSAVFAVKAFRKGLSFSRDAERLVLRLEVERFRLQMWGENCGLATQQHDGILPRLLPLCDVLRHQLDDVAALFREHEALSERYGLEPTTDEPTRSDKLAELVARMQRSFRRSRPRGRAAEERGEDEEEEPDTDDEDEDPKDAAAAATEPGRTRRTTSTWNKIRWSVLDLAKFEALVAELAAHVTRLNQLLAESTFGHHHHQHHPPQPDANDVRVSIVVVGSAVDRESIDLVRSAVTSAAAAAASPASASALLRSGIERKAISADLPASLLLPSPPPLLLPPQPTTATAAAARGSLRLADFALPDNFARLSRFLAERKGGGGGGGGLFLFERKDFDRDISPDDKRRLTERIRRLVVLLGGPRDPALLTPRAEGCIHDAEHYCWWLVFCFTEDDDGTQQQQRRQNPPTTALTLPLDRHQPISLRLLIDPKTKFRPPLEQRYALASALAGTLSELYRSSWLHKGIRSDNILFQPSSSPPFSSSPTTTLPLPPDFHRRPLLCGFDYTRHESEWATIDRARRSPDVAAALYRHPAYQGAAAQGYSLRYDLYSLGLVLLEVALWAPLSNFLEGRPARATSKVAATAANGTTTTTTARAEITLSKDMKTFHEPHARLLRRHVLRHVDAELAFRAGSPYRAAVGYCLGGDDDDADGAAAGRDDDPWSVPSAAAHPALEFYDRVVVPLARLANAAAASA
ncbi:hypothetical protein GGTG_02288 [Gaeumannomyces tritici R3-111a-1]|uniref:Protein kinase domain-containing protein n=1 Tax=Gaeumannomyces tritici (strain R3-111a-1) TaxID=644352 RepID=J3NLY3_GAET3|nr:hypothetical protein GGTG_02288 [Gaeumannomyces tritici R3-111a-1]EJT82314.1 hypothetical protein GGTG_02288 [Gaeumannomyces tritici R3-111a-1]